MIQLDTETASNQNIYAAAVTVLTHTLPASPVEHLVAANIQVSLLAASVSRALTIRLLADAQEVFKADVLFTSVTATADKVRWLAVPPLPLRGGQVITITVQSDHASDTAVTLTAYLASHDLDYILAFRAAEASPTADSPIERLKALDDGTAVVGAKLADVAHGGAAATITLATPIAATVPNTQKVDVETIKTKAVAVDAGGTTFAGTVASPTNITAATGIVLANAAHGGAAATIQLATPVEANAVQISGDAAAADALETVLDGTGGAVLKAAQLKLSCNIDGQGALDCRNANVHGDGQRNEGGEAGLRNTGASVGTLNIGVLQGERNYGTAGQGQYNLGCGGGGDGIGQVNEGNNVGQKNFGSSEAGQKNLSGSGPGLHNFGPTAQKNEAAGVTPKALQFVGAVDLIDGILADTLALDTRLPTIPASQGDVTTAHATTDGKVDAAKASADAAKASADQAARPSDVT
ncbi:MAG: hypothetical protein NTX87_11040, partial [Planctomycetota bacterium]|nr:hypothetical protein [Planctomycetota bacterium]